MNRLLLSILGILALSFLFFWSRSDAAIPTPKGYVVFNEVQMYLNKSISSTATTGIEIAAPKLNGSTYTYNTTSGGILRLSAGSRREDIWYSSGSVNATSKVITLYGVIRGLCEDKSITAETCSDGKAFSRGSIVELNDDARLFNWKANINTVNTFTGSGQIASSQTNQSVIRLNSVTTTERDAFSYVANGDLVYNETTGTFDGRQGGAWSAFGTASVPIATTLLVGKVESATGSDLTNRTGSGSQGTLALSPRNLTMTGGTVNGTLVHSHIPMTDATGHVPVRVGGTGTGAYMSTGQVLFTQNANAMTVSRGTPSSSTYLRGDKTWATFTTSSGGFTINSFNTGSILDVQDASTTVFEVRGDQSNYHVEVGGTDPSVSNCGTSPSVTGTDVAGIITVGSSSSNKCNLTFNKVYDTPPACTVARNWEVVSDHSVSMKTTGTGFFIISTGNFTDIDFSYICIGLQ
tara:strand:+ start:3288 stop:4679 length:1392 start_codon:yes stop_codon:yes gene_type:complete